MCALNGTDVIIRLSDDNGATFSVVGYATTVGCSVAHAVRDITTKESEGNEEVADGLRSFTLNGEGLVTYSVQAGKLKPNDLHSLMTSRTHRFVEVFSTADYDFNFVGYAQLEGYDLEAGTEETKTYSFSMKMDSEAGMGWADYTSQRAAIINGTSEALACMQASIQNLRSITIN